MGYYSEVGLGMFKDDFERLVKRTKFHTANENDKIDAYNCLTKYCDHYYSDSYREIDWTAAPPKETGPKQELVILHWYDIKLYSIGMNYIKNYLEKEAKKSSFLTWVGEKMEDVGFEEYKSEESNLYWPEFIEPISSISIETRGAESTNYEEFIKRLERRE